MSATSVIVFSDRGGLPIITGSRRVVTPELSGVDTVFRQEVVKSRPGNPEQLCRARQIALGDGKRLSDGLRLRALPRGAQVDIFGSSPGSSRPRSPAVTTAPSAMITAPLMRFSSSRTLPGQRCAWIARMASGASPRVGLPKRSDICCNRN